MLRLNYPLPEAASPNHQRSPGRWSLQSGSQKWSCTCQTLQNKQCSVREQPTLLPLPLSSGQCHLCVIIHSSGATQSLTVLFWAPISHQMPLPPCTWDSTMHYSQCLNRWAKETYGWTRGRGMGVVPLLSAHKIGTWYGLSFSRLDFRQKLSGPH